MLQKALMFMFFMFLLTVCFVNSSFASYANQLVQCKDITQVSCDQNRFISVYYHIKHGEDSIAYIKQLLKEGFDVNSGNAEDITPLHMAAYEGCAEIVSCLLAEGAHVHAQDKQGNTPLHVALYKSDCPKVVTILLDYNASSAIQNRAGDTPLHIATYFNRPAALCLLLMKQPMSVTIANINGDTPLHSAALHATSNPALLVQLLATPGAYHDAKNNQGKTFKDIMKEKQAKLMAQILNKYSDQ